jgi:hypothetical protein
MPFGGEDAAVDGLCFQHQLPARIVAPDCLTAGIGHVRALTLAECAFIVVVAHHLPAARSAEALLRQPVEQIVSQGCNTAAGICLLGQVAQVIISVIPCTHIRVAHLRFAPGIVIGQGSRDGCALPHRGQPVEIVVIIRDGWPRRAVVVIAVERDCLGDSAPNIVQRARRVALAVRQARFQVFVHVMHGYPGDVGYGQGAPERIVQRISREAVEIKSLEARAVGHGVRHRLPHCLPVSVIPGVADDVERARLRRRPQCLTVQRLFKSF